MVTSKHTCQCSWKYRRYSLLHILVVQYRAPCKIGYRNLLWFCARCNSCYQVSRGYSTPSAVDHTGQYWAGTFSHQLASCSGPERPCRLHIIIRIMLAQLTISASPEIIFIYLAYQSQGLMKIIGHIGVMSSVPIRNFVNLLC